jgi:type VI secretion system secreted protein Hcp
MKALKRSLYAAAVLAAILVSTVNLPAPIYMKYDGIDGDVTVPGVTNAIQVLSFSGGHSRTNGAAAPALHEIVITKQLDKTSPLLALRAASGQSIPKGVLTCRKAGSTNEYYTITLEEVFITSYQVGGGGSAGDTVPTESIAMNYNKIEWKYQPQDSAGTPSGPPVTARWPPGGAP